jgi:hypothetical protein
MLRAGSGACCHRCTRTSPRAAANGPPTGQRTGLEVIHDKLPCSPRTAVSGWWPHPVRNRPRAADTISAPTTPALLRSRIARMCRPAPAGDASVDPLSRRRDRAEGVDRFVGISLIPPSASSSARLPNAMIDGARSRRGSEVGPLRRTAPRAAACTRMPRGQSLLPRGWPGGCQAARSGRARCRSAVAGGRIVALREDVLPLVVRERAPRDLAGSSRP